MMDIEKALAGVFEGVIDAYNMVTNVECLPYAIFQVNKNSVSNKDGVYRYDYNIEITVCCGSYDDCKSKTGMIVRNLLALRNDDLCVSNLTEAGESDSDVYVSEIKCLIIELL